MKYRVVIDESAAKRAASALRERVAAAPVFAGEQALDELAAEALEAEIARVRAEKRDLAREIATKWRNFDDAPPGTCP